MGDAWLEVTLAWGMPGGRWPSLGGCPAGGGPCLGDAQREVALAWGMPGLMAARWGSRRPPPRIGRRRPSCHLCKLLQQRAEVKRSTCVASINGISRSLAEFLLKSLVAGSVFLTPQMPCGWQPRLCHTLGKEGARAGWGGSPSTAAGGHGGTGTPRTPRQRWVGRAGEAAESLGGHRAPARRLAGRSVCGEPPLPSPLCPHLRALPGGGFSRVWSPARPCSAEALCHPNVSCRRAGKAPSWAQDPLVPSVPACERDAPPPLLEGAGRRWLRREARRGSKPGQPGGGVAGVKLHQHRPTPDSAQGCSQACAQRQRISSWIYHWYWGYWERERFEGQWVTWPLAHPHLLQRIHQRPGGHGSPPQLCQTP